MESRVKYSSLTKTIVYNVGKNPIMVQWRVVASGMDPKEFLDLSEDPEWNDIVDKANQILESSPLRRREAAAKRLGAYVAKRRHVIRRALFLQEVNASRQSVA